MSDGLPKLSESLPMQLLRLREVIMRRVKVHQKAHDLTEQQWRVMRVLAETRSVDMQRLALGSSVHPPSLSRIVPKLVARGLIQRTPSTTDHRQVFVELTVAGWNLFNVIAPETALCFRKLKNDMGEKLFDQLQRDISDTLAALGGSTSDEDPTAD